MKPAAFAYHRAGTVAEALALLAEHGDEAKLLAGGQSLIPAMNFRLVQPAVLIDLNRVEALAQVEETAAGGLSIGAMARQRAVECSALVAARSPLLHQAMPYIAHVPIRNRGTMGGSLAHADPAAELPAVMMALAARLRVQSTRDERWIAADGFFTGPFTTALAPEEMLVEIVVPAGTERVGSAFVEFARRHGDYALAGVAVLVSLDQRGVCEHARVVFASLGDRPRDAVQAAAVLQGETPSPAVIAEAAEVASVREIDPHSDVHATAAYRRHLARVLAVRALDSAFQRART